MGNLVSFTQGSWTGRRIFPSSWVIRGKEGPGKGPKGSNTATLWWSFPDRGAFLARGRHSQIILVMPKLDVVAVITGALKDGYVPTTDLIDGIAAAIKSEQALPPPYSTDSLLVASIHQTAATQPAPVGAPTAEAATITGGSSQRLDDDQLEATISLRSVVDPQSWG